MPLVATSGSGCTIERPQARCTELRNAPQGPLRAPRSPRSNGLQPLRCSEAKAFLRAVAPGSAMVRTPGVCLLGLLASSLLCAIRPCRPRAGCVFCFPLLLLWRSSQALRRVMHNCSDQKVGQVAQRAPEMVVEPLPAGVGCHLGCQAGQKSTQRLGPVAL